MASTRFQIYLTSDQYQKLRTAAQNSGSSIACLVREAIDLYLSHKETPKSVRNDPLWKIIGIVSDSSDQNNKSNECQ